MQEKLEQIVLRAYRLQMPIGAVLKRAKIAPSTWTRWHNGDSQPSESKVDAILAALDQLEAEAKAAA